MLTTLERGRPSRTDYCDLVPAVLDPERVPVRRLDFHILQLDALPCDSALIVGELRQPGHGVFSSIPKLVVGLLNFG